MDREAKSRYTSVDRIEEGEVCEMTADVSRGHAEQPRRHFLYKVGGGFGLAAAILVLIGVASYGSLTEFEETVDWVTHTQQVLGALQAVLSDMQEAQTGLRGYVVTGKEHFLEPYERALKVLDSDQDRLVTLSQDNPEQRRKIENLKALIVTELALLKTMIAVRKDADYKSVQMESYMAQDKKIMDSIRVAIEDMQAGEKTLLAVHEQRADAKEQKAILFSMVGVLLEIIILIWVARQISREIAGRQRAQDALRWAHDELEMRVQERTGELVGSNERLRVLSRQLINVQETERRQIAHDLHDEIGQSLTAMKLSLREAHNLREVGATAPLLADSLGILDQVIQHVRGLALDLRPSLLDELGLVAALKWYVNRQGARAGWETEFAADDRIHRPPAEVEIACFRATQEALTNVARHAEATHVRVTLDQQNGHLLLAIEDNGKGFDVDAARARARTGSSVGLLGMEERVRLVGGSMTVVSRPATGTRIIATFPLTEPTP